ncbi:Uncharacterised protein [Serratia marcescens]|nr:Uncharacterised protein [Serratia marcescens]
MGKYPTLPALPLRQMALVHTPKYLRVPEIRALFHYVPDLHRKLLLAMQ